jgi:SsrA-binding protein
MANLAENRKARFTYEITDTYEAGVELLGTEVKSIRKGQASLDGSYAIIRGGEIYLVGTFIPPYQEKNTDESYDPRRTRKLLITKKEIRELERKVHEKSLTLVPLSLYTKNSRIKISIGLGRGKKKFDKRESIKKRDTDREIDRQYKAR